MEKTGRKKHWDRIYQNKNSEEMSWYQSTPFTSLEFFSSLNLPLNAKIIDIGGGDSYLVDHLLDLGYKNISVLDISEIAIEKAKKRLGNKAESVRWIIGDVCDFHPAEKYDLWHDRATFHFLTDEKDTESYINKANSGINQEGYLLIGTFSDSGPEKCSGLAIRQYSEKSMADRLKDYFMKIKCVMIDHSTPSGSIQNFLFCSFMKMERT